MLARFALQPITVHGQSVTYRLIYSMLIVCAWLTQARARLAAAARALPCTAAITGLELWPQKQQWSKLGDMRALM